MGGFLLRMLDDNLAGVLSQRRNRPWEKNCRRGCPHDLGANESGRVTEPDFGKRIGRGASERNSGFGERIGRGNLRTTANGLLRSVTGRNPISPIEART
jgi:hypothetical protein